LEKNTLASILGTWQACLTDYKYVNPKFKEMAEKERLLGVSMTGIEDSDLLRDAAFLRELRDNAVETNRVYAEMFGITQATAVTCVKPEGTTSQVVGTCEGMHAWHDQHYIRRIRLGAGSGFDEDGRPTDKCDPLLALLKDQGVPLFPENGQKYPLITKYVSEWPVEAPANAVTKRQRSAIEMLEFWKLLKLNYCEHNPSVTVTYRANEVIQILAWLKENWEIVGGISFLPLDEGIYDLAPYESTTAEDIAARKKALENLDFGQIVKYEKYDTTDLKSVAACDGGVCSLNRS